MALVLTAFISVLHLLTSSPSMHSAAELHKLHAWTQNVASARFPGSFTHAYERKRIIVDVSQQLRASTSEGANRWKAQTERSSNPVSLHDAFLMYAGGIDSNRNVDLGLPSCRRGTIFA